MQLCSAGVNHVLYCTFGAAGGVQVSGTQWRHWQSVCEALRVLCISSEDEKQRTDGPHRSLSLFLVRVVASLCVLRVYFE